MTVHDETIAKIRQLPKSLVQEVNDFVEFLLIKHNKEWLFRESATMKSTTEDARAKLMHDLKNPDPMVEAARQKALSELLRTWREEGDEEEQKETGDYLRQVLDEDRLSNRPLFP